MLEVVWPPSEREEQPGWSPWERALEGSERGFDPSGVLRCRAVAKL